MTTCGRRRQEVPAESAVVAAGQHWAAQIACSEDSPASGRRRLVTGLGCLHEVATPAGGQNIRQAAAPDCPGCCGVVSHWPALETPRWTPRPRDALAADPMATWHVRGINAQPDVSQ